MSSSSINIDHDLAPPGSEREGNNSNNNNNNNNNSSKSGKKSAQAAAMASQWAGSMWQSTQQSIQSWTVRKYTLPDKHVASQVLMYRQLLHTSCRPNLTLSREYQGTPAQQAVLDMPWWSQGILESRKMIISYQNLLARLWVSGACTPYGQEWQQYHVVNQTKDQDHEEKKDVEAEEKGQGQQVDNSGSEKNASNTKDSNVNEDDQKVPTTVSDQGEAAMLSQMTPDEARFRAPVPHRHWVDRLGFQQEDPVTDFRSGGILSLAMMVHLVESCPDTHCRFILHGDAAVLPFGLTAINITDMMAKFLMLSKNVDRMDALLSQKPFWRMFADPHAMLVCQETAMNLTADVVVEMQQERGSPVTVFDFANILAIVEQRMEYDYLMAGPTSSQDLRKIHVRNKLKYRQQLQQRMQLAHSKSLEEKSETNPSTVDERSPSTPTQGEAMTGAVDEELEERKNQARRAAVQAWKDRASSVAGNVWQKVKTPGFHKVHHDPHNKAAAAAAPDLLSGSPPKATVTSAQAEPSVPSEQGPSRWNVEGASELDDAEDVLL